VPEILPEAEHILRLFGTSMQEIQHTVLGVGVHCEVLILVHGLLLNKAVAEYDIQKSATNLHLSGTSLSEWRRITSEQQYAEVRSLARPNDTLCLTTYC
jgi:hypothetical protein